MGETKTKIIKWENENCYEKAFHFVIGALILQQIRCRTRIRVLKGDEWVNEIRKGEKNLQN